MTRSQRDPSGRTAGGLCEFAADRPAAAERHFLYLRVRSHLGSGWTSLPDGLTATNIRDLASMACSRRDRIVQSLCRQRGLADQPAGRPT